MALLAFFMSISDCDASPASDNTQPVNRPPITYDNPNEVLWCGKPYKSVVVKVIWTIVLTATVIGVLFLPWIWIPSSTRYEVTRSRLIVTRGWFAKSSNEVRIKDVRNITLTGKNILFGTATLQFDVAGSHGAEIAFARIQNAEGVRDLIRSLQQS